MPVLAGCPAASAASRVRISWTFPKFQVASKRGIGISSTFNIYELTHK
jgi:hypothetical protein